MTFSEGGFYGWFFDGSFTKAADVSGQVADGTTFSAYVTEENLQQASKPASTVKKAEDVSSFNWESIEITDGAGAVLVEVERDTTVEMSVEITTI